MIRDETPLTDELAKAVVKRLQDFLWCTGTVRSRRRV